MWAGAELLIRFSSTLARSMGVSPVIIGLTIVSIGTSLPEFVVSLIAAIQNTMGISIGNIIGSNIANICLILGLGALISDLRVKRSWVTKEVPVMLGATFIFIFFARTGYYISRIEGLILLLFLIIFLFYLSRISIHQIQEFSKNQTGEKNLTLRRKLLYSLLAILGIVILIAGSKFTVDSGTFLASSMGVSDTVIGLTIVAVGTSLPELATTVVGVFQKETDIVVGNVIGSNIFNLLFIGGSVSSIKPVQVDSSLFQIEFIFLVIASVAIWPMMRIQWNVHRYEGFILLIFYISFILITFTAS
ncbi:MAG: calcium/sodium antiporter [Calditrichaeota bacterium]|nr:calcium/sodium antiporter [Calditrichota bacterium]